MLRIFRKNVSVLNGVAGTTAADAAPANNARTYIRFQNTSDTAIMVQFGANAAAASGISVAANSVLEIKGYETGFVPSGRISVFCSVANKSYSLLVG